MSRDPERRLDRSSATSIALDKLLHAAADRHHWVVAAITDESGLLMAAAFDRPTSERVGGVVALVCSLRETLARHDVFPGLTSAELRNAGHQSLTIWPFAAEGEKMILATLGEGPRPGDDVVADLLEGVRRIFARHVSGD